LDTAYGTPWQNFLNWLGSSQGKMVIELVNVALTLSLVTLPAEVLVIGLIVGALFVAGEAVISGGKATSQDYVAAFSMGFAIGTVIGGFYFGIRAAVLGEASLSATEKAGLSGFDEAASRAYVAERGFIGQAPRVSSDVEEALAAADRQTELAQAAKAWYKSTSPSEEASLLRHHTKHVLEELGDNPLELGTTPARYTRDAQKVFAFYRDSALARPVTLADRTPGILIRLGEGLPGGYFTSEGRIVTFWYVAEL